MSNRTAIPVSNITNYDLPSLFSELTASGVPVDKLHKGNRRIIIEYKETPTPEHLTLVNSVLSAHTPLKFTWTEEGTGREGIVACAEDVDRITSRRIRGFIGGDDPIQEQMRTLRLSLFAHDVALFPDDYTQAEKDLAVAIRTQMKAKNTQIEAIRTEGKNYKTSRGW